MVKRLLGIRPAGANDAHAIRDLIAATGLPLDGFESQFPAGYAVFEPDGTVRGVAGLEVHGDAGLLRSVAVHASWRGAGVGRALSLDRLKVAQTRGLRCVYLLTTTAPDFFEHLGFQRVLRDSAPVTVQRAPEFATVCPASAVCLALPLR